MLTFWPLKGGKKLKKNRSTHLFVKTKHHKFSNMFRLYILTYLYAVSTKSAKLYHIKLVHCTNWWTEAPFCVTTWWTEAPFFVTTWWTGAPFLWQLDELRHHFLWLLNELRYHFLWLLKELTHHFLWLLELRYHFCGYLMNGGTIFVTIWWTEAPFFTVFIKRVVFISCILKVKSQGTVPRHYCTTP